MTLITLDPNHNCLIKTVRIQGGGGRRVARWGSLNLERGGMKLEDPEKNNLMGRGKDKEKEVNGEMRRGGFKGEGEGS